MKTATGKHNDARRLGILLLLFVLCTIFYYLGEIIDFLGWRALRWDFFYGVHDAHRLFFLTPIIYAGYFFGARAAIIITIIAVNTFLPRALLISPFPDPLLRTVLFIIIAGVIGYLTGIESERRKHLEAMVREQREAMLRMLEGMEGGVIIVGLNGVILFTSARMVQDFGDGTGSKCQDYLHQFGMPGKEICETPAQERTVAKWEYALPDGRTYQVFATPFIDYDKKVCRLIAFKNITRHKTD